MNFPDTLIIENKCQVQPAPPFTPGDQAAGALKAVGEGVSHGEVLDAAAPPQGVNHRLAPPAPAPLWPIDSGSSPWLEP